MNTIVQPPPTRRSSAADYDHHTEGMVGRFAVTGALIGSLVLGSSVTLGALAVSAETGQALGVGAAVALTGGPFFGALVGFAMAVHAAEARAGARLVPLPTAPAVATASV